MFHLTCGEKKICSTIKKSQNIMNMVVAIKHCKVHHFPDDTNFLYTNNSMKKLNKLLNKDLKNLTNWLNANKITLKLDSHLPKKMCYLLH